jgi:hypothetical protein
MADPPLIDATRGIIWRHVVKRVALSYEPGLRSVIAVTLGAMFLHLAKTVARPAAYSSRP